MNNKATTGARGEAIATEYLRQNGYLICNRNWRSGHYEIDIVATKLGITHIIEVRTRKAGSLLSQGRFVALARKNYYSSKSRVHSQGCGSISATNAHTGRSNVRPDCHRYVSRREL